MPPSKHSGSSRSAHKDSDQIPSDQNYTLGDYSFRIERSSVPGSTNDKIEAICTKGGKNARKSIQVPSSTQIQGWYVEANETEASVYVVYKSDSVKCTGPTASTGETFAHFVYDPRVGGGWRDYVCAQTFGPVLAGVIHVPSPAYDWFTPVLIGPSSSYIEGITYISDGIDLMFTLAASANINGVDFILKAGEGSPETFESYGTGVDIGRYYYMDVALPALVNRYFTFGEEDIAKLVGRFAIDIKDAGGVGPGGGTGGGWTDPEDYDEDWEEGDPTHTLYVEVTGALSGRHNDPIVDPSYSYIPADKDTVKDYGCGGDGGHGGGGGAGASTVVIHKFATNQANSKEVTAIARRHGYGSGGGKGGKGGDGCILVYY